MRRTFLVALAGALTLLGIALSLSAGAGAATTSVNATPAGFAPQNLTIHAGDTVNWTNADSVLHDVTFEAGFGSGPTGSLDIGESYEHLFSTPGVYRYRCTVHSSDFSTGMIGRVTVLDTANGPSAAFTAAPPPQVAPNTTLTFRGVSTDEVAVTNASYTVDGGSAQSLALTQAFGSDSRVVTWTFSLAPLTAGNHTVAVVAQNASGPGPALNRTVEVLTAAPPPVSAPATWTVEMRNSTFVPAFLEVATGDTVEFINRDPFQHDATFDAGPASPTLATAGEHWNITFNATGSFHYRCTFHPPNMVGDIVVYDRALRPAINVTTAPPVRVNPGSTFTVNGTALDTMGVTGLFLQIDNGNFTPLPFEPVAPLDARAVAWNFTAPTLVAGSHTLRLVASNGAHNSTVTVLSVRVAAAPTPPGPPPGNPFGESFLFEDILSKYFWLIVGVTVILLAVVMMFLSYSGKLQNYYIVLLTALDERHRFFAFARPTREFLYTIQRQMPRTHTERYNLKVIWYWYPLYCLGGLSFAAFIIETITGIILGFYYIPEGTGPNEGLASSAYHSMETIMTKVTFGYIFRALHHWGAHMMVAAVFLHMMRVYFVGAYKNPRELNWLLGVILLTVTLLFGYTGYLLPWDQLSFWAGQIGLEMANTIPVIGELIGNMLFGGPELSGATIIRMYYLHVFVLPLIGGALMVLHMGIVWMQGVAEPH